MLLYREKGKPMDFSETIVDYDVKVGRCSQLYLYMNLYEYQRSRSFIDHGPRVTQIQHLHFFFFLETAWPIEARVYVEPSWDGGMKV